MGSEKVQIIDCQSWEDFISKIRNHDSWDPFGRKVYYRGQSNLDWRLSSLWERCLASSGLQFTEGQHSTIYEYETIPLEDLPTRQFLEPFKYQAGSLPGLETPLNNDDWWQLGRHYGLITPLLDWTESPFVAAFFAFVDNIERANPGFKSGLYIFGAQTEGNQGNKDILLAASPKVVVWALTDQSDLKKDNEFEIIRSNLNFSKVAYRAKTQRSLFTRLVHKQYFDLESYLKNRGLQSRLTKFLIPGKEGFKALNDLRRMNINFATMFPDVEGAALQSNLEMTIKLCGSIYPE